MDLVEAMATRRVVYSATELCIFQVEFERDSEMVVNACYQPPGTIQDHVWPCNRRNLPPIYQVPYRSGVVGILRGGDNQLAHSLARRAVQSVDLDVWIEDLPPD